MNPATRDPLVRSRDRVAGCARFDGSLKRGTRPSSDASLGGCVKSRSSENEFEACGLDFPPNDPPEHGFGARKRAEAPDHKRPTLPAYRFPAWPAACCHPLPSDLLDNPGRSMRCAFRKFWFVGAPDQACSSSASDQALTSLCAWMQAACFVGCALQGHEHTHPGPSFFKITREYSAGACPDSGRSAKHAHPRPPLL
jgi:hypothetical protein